MIDSTRLKRKYRFTDGVLIQLVDSVILSATEDILVLDPLGVTTTRLAALEAANNAFRNTDDDVEWLGLVSEKRELKEAALALCETRSNNIRRMVQNVYGNRSAMYKRFGFVRINTRKELERIKAYYRVWRMATEHAADLAAEGLTAAVLADLLSACQNCDAAYDAMEDTTIDRDIAAEARTAFGNSIFAEVTKICNTGKSYWKDKSESRSNRYVIAQSVDSH